MPSADWRSPELLAWLFNESPVSDEVVIDDRWGKDTRHKHGGYYTTEYTAGMQTAAIPGRRAAAWATPTDTTARRPLTDYHTDRELLMMLVDLVSRGGNLLLDIGPTGDGRIPVMMEERLIQIGEWLKPNGEAIYGTRPWKHTRQWSTGEQPKLETGEFMTRYEVTDFIERKKPGQAIIEAFFTAKGDDVFAIVPGVPGERFVLKNAALKSGGTVELMGHTGALKTAVRDGGISVELPRVDSAQLAAQPAFVLRFRGLTAGQ